LRHVLKHSDTNGHHFLHGGNLAAPQYDSHGNVLCMHLFGVNGRREM